MSKHVHCSDCELCKGDPIQSIDELIESSDLPDEVCDLEIKDLETFGKNANIIVYPEFDNSWTVKEIIENSCPPSWKQMFMENSMIVKTVSKKLKIDDKTLPRAENIFRLFRECPLSSIKVVIIAQDPYYTLDRKGVPFANGVAFSINKTQKLTPSLRNIKKELENEGYSMQHGDLIRWVRQGVFMFNSYLTVEEGNPNSHKNIWKSMSIRIIQWICQTRPKTAYLLWGRQARDVGLKITTGKKFITSHPSPRSANRGFIGCNHFNKCNEYLKSIGSDPINWNIKF